MTMKHYKTLWLMMMIMGCLTMTSCSDKDDQDSRGGDEEKNYVERLYPVVDPMNNTLGTVKLRFYNDMPTVAYISVSHFRR